MGSVIPRKRRDGSIAYLAQIMRRNSGKIYRESRTFDREPAARIWIEKREKELDRPGGLIMARATDPTLGDAIDRYISTSRKDIGRTKAQVLASLKAMPIASLQCSKIGSAELVELVEQLSDGRKPQTVQNYLSHLGAVFAVAQPAWGFPLDQQAIRSASAVTKRLGLTSKSRQRDRRPTTAEIGGLMDHFMARSIRRPSSAPMHRIIGFALFSTRRLEEITRIDWADFEPEAARVLVRDMKNPGDKAGNNVWCDLPDDALKIIAAMPRDGGKRIFPYSTDAIGAAFTRACQTLEIDDLHFHDLRHEGVSRLFEIGLNIPHVAAVSGHRTWTSLKRYTHLRHTGDKWAGAPWLATLQTP